jgi:RNA polymerase sigma-70 factor (ECF subfamily)
VLFELHTAQAECRDAGPVPGDVFKYLKDCQAGAAPRSVRERLIEQMYRRDTVALKHYVKRIVRSNTDAEDIVQDAFFRLWRALARGPIYSPRAVLFRTARNLALNHIRNGRARCSETAKAVLSAALYGPVPTAEDEQIALEQAVIYQQVLDELPERYREAFRLRVLDELSYKEISKRLNLPVSTIEKQVGRSKKMCRCRLEQQ